jgi:glyoxylate reductase
VRRVLVTRRLPEGGLDPLAGHEIVGPEPDDRPLRPDELAARASEVDGIVCLLTDPIDAAVLESGAAGGLRVVANVAVGYDNIDVDAARRLGVAVCNTPGVLTESTADVAFLLILAACRRASSAEAALRAGDWRQWSISGFLGHDLHGATLGVVGYGRIGRAVARRAEAFGMRVVWWSRSTTGEPGRVDDLDELFRVADVVTLHVPGGPDTFHLVDDRRLRLMSPSAVLVNTARGSVLDEEALAVALEEGRLFAAGLDVYEHEPRVHPRLLTAPNTVLLPHIGSATVETRTAMARLAAEGVAAVLAGTTPESCVVPPPI